MKIIYFILSCFLLFTTCIYSQVVNENIHFDNYVSPTDNDFTNYFSGFNTLYQDPGNGISGGCLVTTDSISWGNNRSNYCSSYKPALGDTIQASICFKYDATTIHTSSFQRALSLWLLPYTDFNHYIIATVSGAGKIELLTYSWNNNPYPSLALLQDHWYKYLLSVAFLGGLQYQVYIKAEVFDIGLTGLTPPSLVNSSSGSINDQVLMEDTMIQVAIDGASFGGAKYFDDFYFHGVKGFSTCPLSLSTESITQKSSWRIYPAIVSDILNIDRTQSSDGAVSIEIFDATGKLVLSDFSTESLRHLDVRSLPAGSYRIRCKGNEDVFNSQFIVTR